MRQKLCAGGLYVRCRPFIAACSKINSPRYSLAAMAALALSRTQMLKQRCSGNDFAVGSLLPQGCVPFVDRMTRRLRAEALLKLCCRSAVAAAAP